MPIYDAPSPRSPPPMSAPSVIRGVRRKWRIKLVALAIVIVPTVLAMIGALVAVFVMTFGRGDGASSVFGVLSMLIGAFAGAAMPVLIVALLGVAFLFGAWGRLRQGEKTDFDLARERGEDTPRRGAALAAELRADPEIAVLLNREERRRAVAKTVARRRRLVVPLSAIIGAALAARHTGSHGGWLAFVRRRGRLHAHARLWPLARESTKDGRAYSDSYKRAMAPLLLRRFGEFSIELGTAEAAPQPAASDLVPEFEAGMYRLEDAITGRYRGHPIRIDEYRMFRRDKNGRPIRSDFAAAGLLVTTTLRRPLAGDVVVAARFDGRWPSRIALDRVTLEDPAFETIYRTYASDQILARAVLTPRMMQAMLASTDGAGRFAPPLLSVRGDAVAVYAAFHSGADTFLEADAVSAATLDQAALDLDDLAQIFAIIDMLFETQRLRMSAAAAEGDAP
jgi:hypothetical protein